MRFFEIKTSRCRDRKNNEGVRAMLQKWTQNKEENVDVAPMVTMFEKDDTIVLALEMPGADKETLDVNLDGNQMVIRGRTKKEDVGKDYKAIHRERRPVQYERRFEINAPVDREKITARYQQGVLEVTLIKAAAAQPKKIAIQSS